jgi:DNA-binding MarR family transcriptional regulator
MSRKLRLTPLQRDLLWMLEEAGEETLTTILVTLKPSDRETFDRDLASLIRLGFVSVAEGQSDTTVALTESGRQALTK